MSTKFVKTKNLLVFGGTSEEHTLLAALSSFELHITLCVASNYGRLMLEDQPHVSVLVGRLDTDQIRELMLENGYIGVVDATHPYATEVTKNIKAAAAITGTPYFRLQRGKSHMGNAVIVASMSEAAEYLNKSYGNVLVTTGSKELSVFANVTDYKERLYTRVLPTVASIEACLGAGFSPSHIIAMHGPFSAELNIAIIHQFEIKTIVTKDGGAAGGFPEKLAAAEATNASLIVVSRPEEDGLTLDDVIFEITKILEASV